MAANIWVGGGSMKRVNLLARFMNGQEEARSLIGDSSATPRKEREAEGRQRKRSGAEGSPRAAILMGCSHAATGAGQTDEDCLASLAESVSACNTHGWPKVQRFDDSFELTAPHFD